MNHTSHPSPAASPRALPESGVGSVIPAVKPENSAPGQVRHRILVAEDDDGVREVLERILGGVGYQITTAKDGEMAWEALLGANFDLLITDHDMPRLMGLDLVRRLRAAPISMPVILISGRMPAEQSDFPELLRPGTALGKPFSFVELLKIIGDLLVAAPHPDSVSGGPMWADAGQDRASASPFATWQHGMAAGSSGRGLT